MKNPDLDTHAGKVPSPCINVCAMNPETGLCEGCARTIEEIAQWGTAAESVKRLIWSEIQRRKTAAMS
jgi:predicted Fe-S protein YdhL (DUF1289 family)